MSVQGAQSSVIYPVGLIGTSAATITTTYIPAYIPLPYSVRIVKFTNATTVNCIVSWDGVDDHDFIPAGGFLLIDVSSNREVSNIFEIQTGTTFYVRGVSGGTGNFYISAYYGK
jgi:hypothetical protein